MTEAPPDDPDATRVEDEPPRPAPPGTVPASAETLVEPDGEDTARIASSDDAVKAARSRRRLSITLTELSQTVVSPMSGDPAATKSGSGAMTASDAKRDWGTLGAERSVLGSGVAIQVADPTTRLTAEANVTLRQGRMSSGNKSVAGEDFALVDMLGMGGMGTVFRARQASLNRYVAVKIMRSDQSANERARVKFVTEAVITGSLDHPNIISLHELGVTDNGSVFYAMKEVKGREWASVIREKTQAENLDILLRVADAVAFAHDRGVIHRDLKPQNVMLGDFGEVMVMDWGLAVPYRPAADGYRVPMGRAGTPAYMSPEMARAEDEVVGTASDIYLLGAMLYEIVAGQPPHVGETVYACIASAANNEIVPPPRKDELAAIALRAMASRPEDRYESVKSFQTAIREFLRHEESLTLSGRAAAFLAGAGGGSYDGYNKAIFGFSEALALWPDNADALRGEWEARQALVEQALSQGDCDLAYSTAAAIPEWPSPESGDGTAGAASPPSTSGRFTFDAAADNARLRALRARAEQAKRENDARRHRIRLLWRLSAVLVLAVIATLTVSTILVSRQNALTELARQAEADARRVAEEAVEQERAAQERTEEALKKETAARAKEEEARKSLEVALEVTKKAQAAEQAANREAQKATELQLKAAEEARKSLERANKAMAEETRQRQMREEEGRRREQAELAAREARLAAQESEVRLARAARLEDNTRWVFNAAAARKKQAEGAAEAGLQVRHDVALPDGQAMAMLFVPPGEFIMGSPPKEADRVAEEYLHPVMIKDGFLLAATELTRGQWRALVPVESEASLRDTEMKELTAAESDRDVWLWRSKPLPSEEAELPATGISLREVRELLLPALARYAPEGMRFRLPTEAEWEYACRAGTATRFFSGDTVEDGLRAGWLLDNAEFSPHPVGRREANPWGFLDMHGNVHEMVADFYDTDFYLNSPIESPINDEDPGDRRFYVARGGSFINDASSARSAYRSNVYVDNRHILAGVRLALSK